MFSDLFKINIDFEKSHLVFPRIILTILLILVAIQIIKNISAGKNFNSFKFFPKGVDKFKLFGSIFLIIFYFKGMEIVGGFYPNMGYGFLFCSIIFMFLISFLFTGKTSKRKVVAITINSIVTPSTAWVLFGYLFNITLP